MSKGGENRDWGYASCDDDGKLTYTSYEKSGKVNRYTDLGNGKHTHENWEKKEDYNSGKAPDYSRTTESKRNNPSIGEVQKNGGCYLTTACMKHYLNNFDDNCYELTVLRWFRNNFVSEEDIRHYYSVAPYIVDGIEKEDNKDIVYDYIYDNIVDYCVTAIENGNYEEAYTRYKESILSLEELYSIRELSKKFIKILSK